MARNGRVRQFGASLRIRLILLLIAALVPAAGLLIQSAIEERAIAGAKVEVGAIRSVRPIAADLDRMVAAARQLLAVIAHLPDIQARHANGASRLLKALKAENPVYANIGAADSRGIVFASALVRPARIDVAHRAWFRRVMKTRDFAIGDYQVARFSGKPGLTMGYPVIGPRGQVRAVVFVALDLEFLNRFAADLDLPPRSTVLIVDRYGTILARYPRMPETVGKRLADNPLVKAMLGQERALLEAEGPDGIRRVYAFAPVGLAGQAPGAFLAVGIPHETVYEAANARLARNLGLLIMLFGALIALVWVGADRLVLRPVDSLLAATHRLAAGDLSARSGPPYTRGELGELALAFDHMAARLTTLRAQREQAVQDEQKAQAETAALKEVDRLRKQFVNAVSHELRIPLTSIVGYAEFLEDGIGGELSQRQDDFVSHIRQSALRLAGIVDDLLDYARIEAGTFSLRRGPADLRAKVAEIVDSMRPQARDANLSLLLELPEEPQIIDMDPHRIGQVLANLIGNAIKFTPEDGNVTVSLLLEPNRLVCEVSDTGIGIAAAEVSKLFKPFSQLESGRRAGGTGLGLSISKAFVESHGGEIGVRSRPGAGSTFWFWLPRPPESRGNGETTSTISTAGGSLKG